MYFESNGTLEYTCAYPLYAESPRQYVFIKRTENHKFIFMIMLYGNLFLKI